MARILGAEPMYEAAKLFHDRCLVEGRSFLWPEHHIWTPGNVTTLLDAFTGENADHGGRTFFEKWHDQLAEQPETVHRLAVDLIAFYYLFPSNIGRDRKMAGVRTVSRWKLEHDPPDFEYLERTYSASVGHSGMLYSTKLPWQVTFYLEFIRELFSSGIEITDRDACKSLADRTKSQIKYSNPARNIVLHLLFPYRFERIAADSDKQKIAEAFHDRSGGVEDTDDALENIRHSLAEDYGRENLDFYDDEEIRQQWQDGSGESKIPSVERYAVALNAIREAGALPDNYLEMLRSHHSAPHRTITATRLAHSVGYRDYKAANLHYGRLGQRVGELLRWRPARKSDVLVTCEKPEDEWHWIMRPQVAQALEQLGWLEDGEDVSELHDEDVDMRSFYLGPLNVILYGPPGTGKTYHTQRRALEIVDSDSSTLTDAEISERFRNHLAAGRIEFVTFHSSYSYEEFVEGFRYDEDEKTPVLHDGVFQRLVKRAISPRRKPAATEEARIWKVSLGDSSERHILERCMNEGEIAIGWLGELNLADYPDQDTIAELFGSGKTNSVRSVNYLVNEMREGDYVAVYKSRRAIQAIGVVTGAYQYKGEEYDGTYPHVRPVEWLDQREHDIHEMNDSIEMSEVTVYPLRRISLQDFIGLLPEVEQTEERYVLIIDEINRGNLSRILGELITLLEEDKRLGALNELAARLPYSGRTLTVPSNLYVIGTMNTADRSIALIDTALRRRFEFEEMMPDAGVIDRVLGAKPEAEPEHVNLICNVFEALNRRISVLLDRDHQVGHSYFLGAVSMEELSRVLYRSVFPLLQEYFYNDANSLQRVLGTYDESAKRGFVVRLEEYRQAFHEEIVEDQELPWKFHVYPPEELKTALLNTFLDG